MRAALIGLAVLIGLTDGPAKAEDSRMKSACQPIRLTLEMIQADINDSHGAAMVLKGETAKRYLDAISLPAPPDGFGAVLIYRRTDIAVIGFITPDMESACEARMIPATLHDKALMRATSAPT